MSNLDWLYAAIEGRTPGPCTFITTMGTVADEIAAVLKAADKFLKCFQRTPEDQCPHVLDCQEDLEKKFAALAAKGKP